jgi:UDP-N-acetylglucosamine--N-acetylmuramyl-(pentapeptide) pyrophosphoryl-undecaprenol N-acetylglucosamine transferase
VCYNRTYMKIVVTGGGTGGHFYPVIAVVQAVREIVKEKRLLEPKVYFMSADPYNKRILFDNNISFRYVTAGKRRVGYGAIQNFFDLFKIGIGVLQALWKLFWIFPDVVFSKGGYAAFPTVQAARMLGIPVVVHESDSVPGRVNLYTAKFAKKIAISYPYAADAFPERVRERIVWTGQPIRTEIKSPSHEGAFEYLDLEPAVPTLLILGGSQGAQAINEVVLDALPRLVERMQVIHQTGKAHFDIVSKTADVAIQDPLLRKRYRPYDYLNDLAMRMSAGASTLVLTRAGSQLFEVAAWGLPAIVVPLERSISRDQHQNAFNFARAGCGTVIEENNLSDDLLVTEVFRLLDDQATRAAMSEAGKKFARLDAAELIAEEIVSIGLSHE